jgi:hypothetical protein
VLVSGDKSGSILSTPKFNSRVIIFKKMLHSLYWGTKTKQNGTTYSGSLTYTIVEISFENNFNTTGNYQGFLSDVSVD